MVVIDIDGTLLNDDQQVTVRTKRALTEVLDKGIKVVFASGRSQHGIFKVIDELGIDTYLDYYICFNGANVINRKTQECISKNILKGNDLQEIYNWVNESGGFLYAFDLNSIFTAYHNEYATLEAAKNNLQVVKKDITSVNMQEDIFKIVIANRSEELDKLEKDIPNYIFNKYSIARSHNNNLEFLNPFANKAKALNIIANRLELSLNEIIAFGDAGNDIEMIKIAGKGIAMGNAFHDVKEIADHITDSNNNDGVAKALEKFVLM